MDNFTELEYKYNADNIGLQDFQDLMKSIGYLKSLDISSWDYYYTNENNDFIRFRESDTPELTIKRKTTENNNWNRIEVDLPLDKNKISVTIVEEFVNLQNYQFNFKVYKSCFIYWSEYVNYVYYIVYDEQMRECNRFIEVEVNKDKINELASEERRQSEIEAGFKLLPISPLSVLKEAEEKLTILGISSKNRLKKSLFEIFKK